MGDDDQCAEHLRTGGRVDVSSVLCLLDQLAAVVESAVVNAEDPYEDVLRRPHL